jgi:cbb3-type cytochrome oxidase subunit 3
MEIVIGCVVLVFLVLCVMKWLYERDKRESQDKSTR